MIWKFQVSNAPKFVVTTTLHALSSFVCVSLSIVTWGLGWICLCLHPNKISAQEFIRQVTEGYFLLFKNPNNIKNLNWFIFKIPLWKHFAQSSISLLSSRSWHRMRPAETREKNERMKLLKYVNKSMYAWPMFPEMFRDFACQEYFLYGRYF